MYMYKGRCSNADAPCVCSCTASKMHYTHAHAQPVTSNSTLDDVEIDYETFISGIFSMYDPCTRKECVSKHPATRGIFSLCDNKCF